MCTSLTKSPVRTLAFAAAIAALTSQREALAGRVIETNSNGPAGERIAEAEVFRAAGIDVGPAPAAFVTAAAAEDLEARRDHELAIALSDGLVALFEKANRGAFSGATTDTLNGIADALVASHEAAEATKAAYEALSNDATLPA